MSTSISAAVIEEFKNSLSGGAAVVTPTSDNYAQSLERWATSAERKASVVVFPTCEEDISAAILFAQTHSLELAVKGGGHSTGGYSSTEGGLCIDLDKMRKVVVDVEGKTVTAQGGALWADVDIEAGKFGLACVGGTVNTTGIGGLTLGGGLGWLTGTHGLVIDNLLSATVVLPSGSVMTASAIDNPDLFWALRGAGASFGVVTSFKFKAHDQPNPVWAGLLVFSKEKLEKLIEFGNFLLENSDGRQGILMGYGAPPPVGVPSVMAVVFSNTSEEEAKEFYKPLLDLEPIVNMTHVVPYHVANSLFNTSATPGLRRIMKGSAFTSPVPTTFAKEIFEDFEVFVGTVPDAAATIVLIEFYVTKKLLAVEQSATAFASRGDYANVLFAPSWQSEEFDGVCRDWSRKMAAKTRGELMKIIRRQDTDDVTKTAVGEYGNYDGLNSSADTLFGENLPRLKALKKEYDPTNVFGKGPNLLA